MLGIQERKIVGAYSLWLKDIPFLFTHAGLRPAMMQRLIDHAPPHADIAHGMLFFDSIINNKLITSIQKCTTDIANSLQPCLLNDEIFQAGPERHGRSIGGSYWTDFQVLKESAQNDPLGTNPFIQIVGHSIGMGKIRHTSTMNAVCVDVGIYLGGRAYLEIGGDGHLTAIESMKQNKTKQWQRTDLSKQYCMK